MTHSAGQGSWYAPAIAAAVLLGGCAPTLRTIPVANPVAGPITTTELRIPHPDRRTQRICARNLASDCLDNFWRIEAATPGLVVIRYRRVAMSVEDARADADWVSRLSLVLPDGRRVGARLHERFDVEQLEPLHWTDRALARVGPETLQVDPDGTIRRERELRTIQTRESTARYSGANFIVFEGQGLIGREPPFVVLEFPGGLLGGGAQWTFSFRGAMPANAIPSRGPTHDRPEWARLGRVHR